MRQIFLFMALTLFLKDLKSQSVISKGGRVSSFSLNHDTNVSNYFGKTTSSENKPVLDFYAIENWTVLGSNKDLSISGDGRYFAYTIRQTSYKNWVIDSLVVQSTTSSWRKSFAGARSGFFSANDSQYVFQAADVLYFVKLGTDQIRSIKNVISYVKPVGRTAYFMAYQLKNTDLVLHSFVNSKDCLFEGVASYSFEGNGDKIVCQRKNPEKTLEVYDAITGVKSTYRNVSAYKFNESENRLAIVKSSLGNNELHYINDLDKSEVIVWSSPDRLGNITGLDIDPQGEQLVFSVKDRNTNCTSIWYWKLGMNEATVKASDLSQGMGDNLVIVGDPKFTGNSRYVRITLGRKPEIVEPIKESVKVDIWTYFDKVNPVNQLYRISSSQSSKFSAIINTSNGLIISETEKKRISRYQQSIPGDFVVFSKSGKDGDRFWEKGYYLDSNWIISLKDGTKKFMSVSKDDPPLWISPQGQYLIYFDKSGGDYFSCNLQTGTLVNISAKIPRGIMENGWDDGWPTQTKSNTPFGVASWQMASHHVWIYSRYDIWQLDLAGKEPPKDLTNGFGYSHKIMFRLMGSGAGSIIQPNYLDKYILLKASNTKNKDNGFYRLSISKRRNPELLYMGPCVMEKIGGIIADDMIPLKAASSERWIVKKQSTTEAPNYFLTNDFKRYSPLTNIQLQKKYNWLTSKLYSYRRLDGKMSQGVLYKPENFDSSKKYPVIIAFYFNPSFYKNFYPVPEFLSSPLSPTIQAPTWLVSHGYLVFTPDIDFSKGYWGSNTLSSIVGAARFLSELSFVSSNHIAAVGHSNSGRFGYYLLTHSKNFAAMSIGSGAGGTDIISYSLYGNNQGVSELEWAERGSMGGGLGNLWQNKKVWLDHTAVLNAEKVSSPLLLFHNKNDGDDVRLALELFTALRRLEKKVWWLQYDDGSHGVSELRDLKDFTIRYTQFFDHYLKNAPAPTWMTKGIPARLKGIVTGYSYDPANNCGKDCKVCKYWNERMKKDSAGSMREIHEKAKSEHWIGGE